jgi:hypothetical protein
MFSIQADDQMPEEKNISMDNTDRTDERKSAGAEQAASAESDDGVSSSSSKVGLKKLLGYGKAVLDYIDEEVPEPPEKADKPKSKLRKQWASFNSFLDSLEPPAEDGAPDPAAGEKTGERKGFLKMTGIICWTSVFFASILAFLLAATVLATYKSMDYVKTHAGTFYPDKAVMNYLSAEHEHLEAVADRISGKQDNLSADLFDARSLEMIKPVRIYSDEYGVYLMTRDSWYGGEHGIFIAKDAGNMREDFNWGVIAGRVFAYSITD